MTDKTLIEDLQTLQSQRVDSYGIGTLQAAQRVVKESERFPMLGGGPPITWATARLIYKVYDSGSQSLERIAERGGFGWRERSS